MKVGFCSKRTFAQLTPDPETVVIYLLSTEAPDVQGWGSIFASDFKLLTPTGSEGSFKQIDDQANKLGRDIFPYVKDAKKILAVCEYGEIRSLIVATSIACSGLTDGWFMSVVYEVSVDTWTAIREDRTSIFDGADIFGWRSVSRISETINDLLEEQQST